LNKQAKEEFFVLPFCFAESEAAFRLTVELMDFN
jgi:hypothetical protein